MASQRDIRRRITSVQNTRKITKAMEMVAAARLRRAQQRIEATRPYALNMLEFIGRLVRYLQVRRERRHPLLQAAHAKSRRWPSSPSPPTGACAGPSTPTSCGGRSSCVDTYAAQGVDSDLVHRGPQGRQHRALPGLPAWTRPISTSPSAPPSSRRRPSPTGSSGATTTRPSTGCTWSTTASRAPWSSTSPTR